MGNKTFMDYLTKDEILTTLTTTSKKQTSPSLEQAQAKLNKAIKNQSISSSKVRKTWSKSMSNLFFSEFQRVYSFTPTKKFDTSSKLKKDFEKQKIGISKELKISSVTSYISKISSSPLHFLLAITFKPIDNFQDLLLTPLKSQMIISVFPENGLATHWPMDKDQRFKFGLKFLQSVFVNVSEIKVNALLLRKYSTEETINKLVISTPQEIAGFTGLDVIEFRGSSVILGLSGLKRRHDANVDVITRVGPFTEIESDSICIKCGLGILFKKYDSITSLLNVIKIG